MTAGRRGCRAGRWTSRLPGSWPRRSRRGFWLACWLGWSWISPNSALEAQQDVTRGQPQHRGDVLPREPQLPQPGRRDVPHRRIVPGEPEQLHRPGEDHRLPASVQGQITRRRHPVQDGSCQHIAVYQYLIYYAKYYEQSAQVRGTLSGDLGPGRACMCTTRVTQGPVHDLVGLAPAVAFASAGLASIGWVVPVSGGPVSAGFAILCRSQPTPCGTNGPACGTSGCFAAGCHRQSVEIGRELIRKAAGQEVIAMAAPPPPSGYSGTPGTGTDSGQGLSGWTAARIVSVVIGAVLVLISLGLLGAGGTALWAETTQRDAGGYLDLGTATSSTTGYALASDTIDLHAAGNGWDAAKSLFGTVHMQPPAFGRQRHPGLRWHRRHRRGEPLPDRRSVCDRPQRRRSWRHVHPARWGGPGDAPATAGSGPRMRTGPAPRRLPGRS